MNTKILPPGFREIGIDVHGYRVFQHRRITEDGLRLRIVHPGRKGDTPMFLGRAGKWRLVRALNWPAPEALETSSAMS
jgi:hypothetical protein